jgi:hypothetical protein
MSQEETQIYNAIIEEQIRLQKIQAMLNPLDQPDGLEKRLSRVSRRVKNQRAVLTALWEKARARHPFAGCVNTI